MQLSTNKVLYRQMGEGVAQSDLLLGVRSLIDGLANRPSAQFPANICPSLLTTIPGLHDGLAESRRQCLQPCWPLGTEYSAVANPHRNHGGAFPLSLARPYRKCDLRIASLIVGSRVGNLSRCCTRSQFSFLTISSLVATSYRERGSNLLRSKTFPFSS